MDFITIILTTLLSAVALFLIAKLMGHKQVAQLDFFDYICGITIGSIAAELATDLESPWKALLALIVYGLISVLLSRLTNKFPRTRKYINGTPTIVMNNGKLYRQNLKKAKLDLSEFLLLCREQGYFDLSEIQTAVFEANGKLSVLPTAAARPATPSDLQIPSKATHIGVELIMDGRILDENVSEIGQTKEWLQKQLNLQGYRHAKEIFLAIWHEEDRRLSLYAIA